MTFKLTLTVANNKALSNSLFDIFLYICSKSPVPLTRSTPRADADIDPFGVTATDDNFDASDVPVQVLEDLTPSSRYVRYIMYNDI